METLHVGMGVDVRDFAAFARALRKGSPEVALQLRVDLRAVGEIVASEARVRAAEWSKTIPPSIRVRTSGATVSVIAGGSGVPLAGLFELGNQGQRGLGGTDFRHPVWGNRNVWVSQPMHPFLAPSLEAKIDAVEVAAVEALDSAIASIVGWEA